MKVALQELPNFEEEIEDDPLKLLESIVLLMHTPMRALYPHMGLIEAIARLVNMCQYENEDMISYVERFKQERQIVKSLMGRGCLDYFIKNMSKYKKEKEIKKKEEVLENAFKVFTSIIFAQGTYSKKYRTMLEQWRSQYGEGRDQYPKSLQAIVDAMQLHKNDDRKLTKSGAKHRISGDDGGGGENATLFAEKSLEKRCYACGSKEYVLTNCTHKDNILRSQWYDRTNREFTLHQSEGNDNDNQLVASNANVSVISRMSATGVAWSGAQFYSKLCLNKNTKKSSCGAHENDVVILDSRSTDSLFKSRNLITNTREAEVKIKLDANVGSRIIDELGDIKGLGTVYFNENGIANIFSLKELVKHH